MGPGFTSSTIPSAGAITSFSHIGETTVDSTISLAILRPAGLTGSYATYSVAAKSGAKTPADAVMNTYPVRIPVNAGDIIGAVGGEPVGAAHKLGILDTSVASANTISWAEQDTTVGASIVIGPPMAGSFDSAAVDLSAVVEADADGDGYGDETQDTCPSQKTTQGACDLAGPMLTLKAAKKQKTKKSFFFSVASDETSTATITGKLFYLMTKNGKKVKKSIKLKSVTSPLAAGASTKFTFKLSSKAKAALKTAGKLNATLKISSTDAVGNASTNPLSLTIIRK